MRWQQRGATFTGTRALQLLAAADDCSVVSPAGGLLFTFLKRFELHCLDLAVPNSGATGSMPPVQPRADAKSLSLRNLIRPYDAQLPDRVLVLICETN